MAVVPIFAKVQKWTGMPASLQAFIFLNVLVWKAVTGELAKEIALLVGTLYPFFKSLHALQTDTDVEDDKTWLTYWMVFGCFTVADMHVGWILTVIPFYYTLKLLFFIWLQLPLGPFMGAKIIYRYLLRPLFRCVGPAINRFAKRHADDLYQLDRDMKKNLENLKKTALETGTQAFVETAMERMAETQQTAEDSEDE